jgi:hypothetical protein
VLGLLAEVLLNFDGVELAAVLSACHCQYLALQTLEVHQPVPMLLVLATAAYIW